MKTVQSLRDPLAAIVIKQGPGEGYPQYPMTNTVVKLPFGESFHEAVCYLRAGHTERALILHQALRRVHSESARFQRSSVPEPVTMDSGVRQESVYKPEVILLPSKEILVPDASVVGHSLGARSIFNLEQAIPTAASQIRNASESIVDQHRHLFDSVGYQGLRNLLLIPLRVVGIEVKIGLGPGNPQQGFPRTCVFCWESVNMISSPTPHVKEGTTGSLPRVDKEYDIDGGSNFEDPEGGQGHIFSSTIQSSWVHLYSAEDGQPVLVSNWARTNLRGSKLLKPSKSGPGAVYGMSVTRSATGR
ncbi:hypothetical protein V8D89_005752 [Ganoderma adspersum]